MTIMVTDDEDFTTKLIILKLIKFKFNTTPRKE